MRRRWRRTNGPSTTSTAERMKRAALGIALGLALLSGCDSPRPANQDESSWESKDRNEGDARWRQIERDYPAGLRLQNLSVRPIHCFVDARLQAADQEWIIFPGRVREMTGAARRVDCEIYPERYVRQVVPRDCRLKVESAPRTEDFYPREALRLGTVGDAVLEFSVDAAAHRLERVRIVSSTGDESLDNAALRMSQEIRATSACASQRYNIKVRFKILEERPEVEKAG
jgi:TonB family protein